MGAAWAEGPAARQSESGQAAEKASTSPARADAPARTRTFRNRSSSSDGGSEEGREPTEPGDDSWESVRGRSLSNPRPEPAGREIPTKVKEEKKPEEEAASAEPDGDQGQAGKKRRDKQRLLWGVLTEEEQESLGVEPWAWCCETHCRRHFNGVWALAQHLADKHRVPMDESKRKARMSFGLRPEIPDTRRPSEPANAPVTLKPRQEPEAGNANPEARVKVEKKRRKQERQASPVQPPEAARSGTSSSTAPDNLLSQPASSSPAADPRLQLVQGMWESFLERALPKQK